MSMTNDPKKYIQKLVKIITEKEKLIDQLKRQNKVHSRCEDNQEERNSIVEEQLRQELKQTNEQVRALVNKMEVMGVKIQELSLGLYEETKANQQLIEQISKKQQKQKDLQIKICNLQQQIVNMKQYEDLYNSTKQQLQTFQKQATSLHQKMKDQQSSQLHYFTSLIQQHESEQIQLRQMIGGIYSRLKLYPFTKTTHDDLDTPKTMIQVMHSELKHIDQYIKDMEQPDQTNVLNETLGDISIIMKSFEEKLENVHCLTKRQNMSKQNHNEGHDSLKQTARSVPVSSKQCMLCVDKENGICSVVPE